MSAISTVYDNFRTVVGTTLSSHVELVNAYIPDEGTDLEFRQGWGIALSGASNTRRLASCKYSIARDIVLTITRRLYITSKDIQTRVDTEKLLFEDQKAVISAVMASSLLNSNSEIAKSDFITDNGLEFIRAERQDIIMLQSIFNVEYFETYS